MRGIREIPRFWERFRPVAPWGFLEPSDCREANGGELELTRDIQRNGHAETHIGLQVVGSIHPDLLLGFIAIRCERHGSTLVPLTLSIPETASAAIHIEEGRWPASLRQHIMRRDRWLAR